MELLRAEGLSYQDGRKGATGYPCGQLKGTEEDGDGRPSSASLSACLGLKPQGVSRRWILERSPSLPLNLLNNPSPIGL